MTHVPSGLNELFGEEFQTIALCFSSVLPVGTATKSNRLQVTQKPTHQ